MISSPPEPAVAAEISPKSITTVDPYPVIDNPVPTKLISVKPVPTLKVVIPV